LSIGWALVADSLPIYPLYALLFVDTGLSTAQVSALFAIWSTVSIVAEVPTGALADRFSRRGALVVYGVLQASGFAVWITMPGFAGFAVGFVLWGLGGSLANGAFEALLYDGLAAVGAQEQYARVKGWVTAAGLLTQVPAAVAATLLFSAGGYALAGWVSIGLCLVAAGLATRLPEPPRSTSDDAGPGYVATLRAGLTEAATDRGVRVALLAVATLTALDAIEEYFGLVAYDWGVPAALVPLAVLAIPLAGAAGAALGGTAARLAPRTLGLVLLSALALLAAAGLAAHPAGLVAVTVFYGLYRMVLVVVDARLQEQVTGAARATVTSVAGLGTDLTAMVFYAAWAVGELVLVAALWALVALALPRWLRARMRV
jgi:MFS family permease